MKKVIYKITLLSLTAVSLFSLASCGQKTYYHNLVKLAPYMHAVIFDDYVEDTELETSGFLVSMNNSAGCSSIRNSDFFGRNLDCYYADTPYFLVKMNANKSKNRYASIGIALNHSLLEDDVVATEKNNNAHFHSIEIAPARMVDGINENGVACCHNVCALEDLSGPERTIIGTNTGKPRLYAYFVCRYVLDYAKSAKHAIELLKELDIFLSDKDYNNLHYMICDKEETYVVELYDNKLVVQQKFDGNQIMTNSYLNLTKEQIEATYEDDYKGDMTYPNYAHGVERLEHLKDNYDNANTLEGMRNTLKEIRFSTMYPDHGGEIPLIPDNPSEDYSQTQIFKGEYPGWEELYKGTRMVLDNHRRDLAIDNDVWITTHSSIYNFATKELDLIVQEDYSRSFKVNFDDFSIKQVDLI